MVLGCIQAHEPCHRKSCCRLSRMGSCEALMGRIIAAVGGCPERPGVIVRALRLQVL